MRITQILVAALLMASPALCQSPDPFETSIPTAEGVIRVNIAEFASLPDIDGVAARMMHVLTEPGTRRIFVVDMRGPLYSVSYDGKTVVNYVEVSDPKWGVGVQSQGRERGVQSFAFHPQFGQAGTPGFGKFYTWTDTNNQTPEPDYLPSGGGDTHDTVLFEWTARTPTAATYDGEAPREMLRIQQPYANHNGGMIGFKTGVPANDPDFGLLYIGIGDGGSGGDPNGHAQNLGSIFGKILRLDPMGRNSTNRKYGIPSSNPFVAGNNPATLGEIYAYGVRNPQRFTWDPQTGSMFLADIGQNIVEELSVVTSGANLGWNVWEGSYGYGQRGVDLSNPRGDPKVTFPIAEYGQIDPLFQNSSAASGVHIFRNNSVPALRNMILFGDNPSGEIFAVRLDPLPTGGQDVLRRVLFNQGAQSKTLLDLIKEKNSAQGKQPASRADMRIGTGPDGQALIINKGDGTVRVIMP
jgi:hypothetical protein